MASSCAVLFALLVVAVLAEEPSTTITASLNETTTALSNTTTALSNTTEMRVITIDNTTMAKMPLGMSGDCAGVPDGLYPFTNFTFQLDICDKYMLCANGVAYPLFCPIGQVFDADNLQCKPRGLVERPCGLKEPLTPALLPSCLGKNSTDKKADIGSCRKYWQCTANGTVANATDDDASALHCERGMVFDEKNNTCVSADLIDGCHPQTDSTLANFCKVKGQAGLFRDPLTCNRAIICLKNTQFYYSCGGWPSRMTGKIGRMFFSPTTLECVHELKEKCTIGTMPPLSPAARRRRNVEAQ